MHKNQHLKGKVFTKLNPDLPFREPYLVHRHKVTDLSRLLSRYDGKNITIRIEVND